MLRNDASRRPAYLRLHELLAAPPRRVFIASPVMVRLGSYTGAVAIKATQQHGWLREPPEADHLLLHLDCGGNATAAGSRLKAHVYEADEDAKIRRKAQSLLAAAHKQEDQPRVEQRLAVPLELVQAVWKDANADIVHLLLGGTLWWDMDAWSVGRSGP